LHIGVGVLVELVEVMLDLRGILLTLLNAILDLSIGGIHTGA